MSDFILEIIGSWDNAIKALPFVTAIIVALSYYFSILEYYKNKARWDYFFVFEICRSGLRTGFKAEHLCKSLIASLVALLILTNIEVKDFIQTPRNACWLFKAHIIILLIFLVFSFLTYRVFTAIELSRGRITKRKYYAMIGKMSLLQSIKNMILISLIYFSVRLLNDGLIEFALFGFVVIFIYVWATEYGIGKLFLSIKLRSLNTTRHNCKDYVILEITSAECYLVPYSIYNIKGITRISLNLDEPIILPRKDLKISTVYFDEIDRITAKRSVSGVFK